MEISQLFYLLLLLSWFCFLLSLHLGIVVFSSYVPRMHSSANEGKETVTLRFQSLGKQEHLDFIMFLDRLQGIKLNLSENKGMLSYSEFTECKMIWK